MRDTRRSSSVADPGDPLSAGEDFLADLNRLLREGLAAVEWADDGLGPRYRPTLRGRMVLVSETSETGRP